MSTEVPLPWLIPHADGATSPLEDSVHALGEMMAGRARLWLAEGRPPAALPPGFEETALVVPTSGSTGGSKAVALDLGALRASQDATAALFAVDGTAAETSGHGFWLPLLPPTHIAGVQVIARAHRTAEVLGLAAPALPEPLPGPGERFDSASFLRLAEPALEQARAAGLPALTSLVPTQLMRIVRGASGADARARRVLRGFAAVLVGGAAIRPELLSAARAQRIAVRTTYGCSETAGGCVYDRRPLPGVRIGLEDPDPSGAGRLLITSPTVALGYLTREGGELLHGRFLTSDLATISADGALTVLGRADDVINSGGRKVLPQDVEHAIGRSPLLEGMIRDSVVVGVADPEWGQRVEALVTLTELADPAEAPALVRAALRTADLASHLMPRRVHVVEELPLLGIGKVDRAAARRLAEARG